MKYQILYEKLKDGILTGLLPAGYRFPVEPELAKQEHVARVTLRAAMAQLEKEGLVRRIPRKGTFVCPPGQAAARRILVIDSPHRPLTRPGRNIMPGIQRQCVKLGLEPVEVTTDQVMSGQCRPEKTKYLGVILLISGQDMPEGLIPRILEMELPVAVAHGKPADEGHGFAVIEGSGDTGLMIPKHLIGLGHRRILTIGNEFGMLRDISRSEYEAFLRANGCGSSTELIRTAHYYFPETFEAALEPVFHANPPTAVYCYSDFYAMRVLEILNRRNIRVPQDIAVAGYSGYPGSALFLTPLTTLDQHFETRGELAVELIMKSAEWYGGTPPVLRLPAGLLIRKSTMRILL